MRPALRYHGGKWRLREWVISHFPFHVCYVEPFGGAGSVLLSKAPARVEVYNDLDGEIVNFFRVLRDPGQSEQLRRMLELTPFARDEYNEAFTHSIDPVENARRLVVRSFQGVGANAVQTRTRSGWRVRTAKADKNAYAGDWSTWPNEIPTFHKRLITVQIENRHWQDLLNIYDAPNTLWYCDPPYPRATRSHDHRCVYRNELSDEDHVALCTAATRLEGYCVLSSYRNPIYDEILEGWACVTREARAQTNQARVEALYISPRTWGDCPTTLWPQSG